MAIAITLDWKEMILAAHAGVLRQVENVKKRQRPKYGAGNQNDWQLHIEGCLGEYAAAKILGVFPTAFGKYGESDLYGHLEVRTRSQPWHSLILHDDDPDDAIFILITGVNGTYTMEGWIVCKDGRKPEYWKDPAGGRPAYFVPTEALNPIEELVHAVTPYVKERQD